MVWFWVTPVIYPSARVWGTLGRHQVFKLLYLSNPMASIVMGFQRALYGIPSPGNQPILAPVSVLWLAGVLACVCLGSIVLLGFAWRTFFHLSGDFAEEL
jgi:ABC-type polysaccharide/polyol phosphate export permease